MTNFDAFAGNTLYATHGLQSYAAKCPPQLVRYGLRYYSKPGETVLDPMVGSGTTLIEARLTGRHSIGYDIDPLARLIARVKSREVKDERIKQAHETIMRRAKRDLAALRSVAVPAAVRERATPPDFPNRDHWFSPEVSETLAILSYHISQTPMSIAARDFLWVAFASLILAKKSVANARDIIHSRTHYWRQSELPDVMGRFDARVSFMCKKMAEFSGLCQKSPSASASARLGDARHLSICDESIDLIFTSPPYATALDYTRAHFLAVAWIQPALGITLEDYRAMASNYIGSERGHLAGLAANDATRPSASELAQWVIWNITHRSARHAKLIQRYFVDMEQALSEIARVLKNRRHAILVVCPSHIRKVNVPTHEVLVELADEVGLKLKKKHTRTIYRHRRMLPYMQEAFGKRMSTEYILVFQKT